MAFPTEQGQPSFSAPPLHVSSLHEKPYQFVTEETGKPLVIYVPIPDFDGPDDVVMSGTEDDDRMQVDETKIPEQFICPITIEIMEEPYIDVSDGRSYERKAIFQWLKKDKSSPMSRQPLTKTNLAPNFALQKKIKKFREEHPDLLARN